MISATPIKYKHKRNIFLAFLLLPFVCLWASPVSALTIERKVDFSPVELKKDVSATGFGEEIKVTIKANTINAPINLKIRQLERKDYVLPDNWQVASEIYSYQIGSASASIQPKINVQFNLNTAWPQLKRIFAYNEKKGVFEEQNSETLSEYEVKSSFSSPRGIVVVLVDMSKLEFGDASWYKYKNCNCVASPDYPKGTLLKVKNLENSKEIVVKVNDFGPIRAIFPKRVIDLDKVAFKKLGILSSGILKKIVVTKIK